MAYEKKALFLDRDGVVIIDKGYLRDVSKVRLVSGVVPLAKRAKELGYRIIVITNQSGIGRGLITKNEELTIRNKICSLFSRRGINICDWFICEHKPEDRCECRKPKPGLFLRALKKHSLDPEKCVAVGDKPADSQAAKTAGVALIYQKKSNYWIWPDCFDYAKPIVSLREVKL